MLLKKSILLLLILLLPLTIPSLGCAKRVPRAQTAHHIIKKHFAKYGKKYKLTDFGKFPVEKVEIIEIREIQKGLAEIFAFIILQEGGKAYKIRFTATKKMFWRYESWENLESSS